MLIALAGLITGYRGDFPFEAPGDEFGDHIYIGMRAVCKLSACGSLEGQQQHMHEGEWT